MAALSLRQPASTNSSPGACASAAVSDRYVAAELALTQPIMACPHVFDDTEAVWFVDVFNLAGGVVCASCDIAHPNLHERRSERALFGPTCARCDRTLSVVEGCIFPPVSVLLTLRRLNASRIVQHEVCFFGLQCTDCAERHA